MDEIRFEKGLLVLFFVLLVVIVLLVIAGGVSAETVYIPLVRNAVGASPCTFTDLGSVAYLSELKMQVVVAGLQTLIIYPCGYDGRYGDIRLEVWALETSTSNWVWERITFFGVIPSCTSGQFIQRAIPNGLRCGTYDPMILAFDENGFLVDSGVFY